MRGTKFCCFDPTSKASSKLGDAAIPLVRKGSSEAGVSADFKPPEILKLTAGTCSRILGRAEE